MKKEQQIKQLNSFIEERFWDSLANLLAEDEINQEVLLELNKEIVSYVKQRQCLGD